MRTHCFEGSLAVLAFVVASCTFPRDSGDSSCEDDSQLCPQSSRAATSVTCDCKCTIGISDDTGESYDGHVAVCLPAELNATSTSGTDETRSALRTLESHQFDQ